MCGVCGVCGVCVCVVCVCVLVVVAEPDRITTLEDQLHRHDEVVDKLLGDDRSGARLIDHPLRGAYAANDEPDARSSDNGADVAAPPTRGTDLSALVDALEALRRRTPGEAAPTPSAGDSPIAAAPIAEPEFELSDTTIDEITRRVLERLAPGAVRPVVTDVITRVAERLLREEIARLKT